MGDKKNKGIDPVINDHACMCNKQSEFLYHPIDVVEAFSMRRQAFREMLKTPEAHHLKNEIKINYKYGI